MEREGTHVASACNQSGLEANHHPCPVASS
uniref:Uncharacterized protein n=1 Tax=Arundo donax TaxID=35708 RepID=A0A0A9DAV6_ARUDO